MLISRSYLDIRHCSWIYCFASRPVSIFAKPLYFGPWWERSPKCTRYRQKCRGYRRIPLTETGRRIWIKRSPMHWNCDTTREYVHSTFYHRHHRAFYNYTALYFIMVLQRLCNFGSQCSRLPATDPRNEFYKRSAKEHEMLFRQKGIISWVYQVSRSISLSHCAYSNRWISEFLLLLKLNSQLLMQWPRVLLNKTNVYEWMLHGDTSNIMYSFIPYVLRLYTFKV